MQRISRMFSTKFMKFGSNLVAEARRVQKYVYKIDGFCFSQFSVENIRSHKYLDPKNRHS